MVIDNYIIFLQLYFISVDFGLEFMLSVYFYFSFYCILIFSKASNYEDRFIIYSVLY